MNDPHNGHPERATPQTHAMHAAALANNTPIMREVTDGDNRQHHRSIGSARQGIARHCERTGGLTIDRPASGWRQRRLAARAVAV